MEVSIQSLWIRNILVVHCNIYDIQFIKYIELHLDMELP